MLQTSEPSTLRNTLLITAFDVQKLFFQRRGVIAISCFSLVWLFLLIYPIHGAVELLNNPNFKDFIIGFAQMSQTEKLLNWQVPELTVYWVIALYLYPMFSIIITADQFASDKQRGTLRFLLLRSNRDSLFFGRFLAQMLIQTILIALSLLATIFLACYRDIDLLLPSLSSSGFIVIALIINLLPYTALMSLLSLHANSARQATLYAVLFWMLTSLGLAILNYFFPVTEFLQFIKPGVQLSDMLNTQGAGVLTYSMLPIIQAVAFLALGRVYMQRSAL
ncbi:ABC transporter [Parashewanella curva]|uniref:ABC transporter n=1 Tax=Parashewanella curva TaxID=2338552 RepID=A0A3L8Q0N7_9GAMM|nr:ABC transporter permease subunit [Parashewanella curva]RLV61145.1 ABC transporter [Parashewanella curva]